MGERRLLRSARRSSRPRSSLHRRRRREGVRRAGRGAQPPVLVARVPQRSVGRRPDHLDQRPPRADRRRRHARLSRRRGRPFVRSGAAAVRRAAVRRRRRQAGPQLVLVAGRDGPPQARVDARVRDGAPAVAVAGSVSRHAAEGLESRDDEELPGIPSRRRERRRRILGAAQSVRSAVAPAAGAGGYRAADRVREPGEPAAGAHDRAAARGRGAPGAGRVAGAGFPAAARRESGAGCDRNDPRRLHRAHHVQHRRRRHADAGRSGVHRPRDRLARAGFRRRPRGEHLRAVRHRAGPWRHARGAGRSDEERRPLLVCAARWSSSRSRCRSCWW